MNFILRSYTAADIDALLEIQRQCFPPPYPQDQLWQAEQLMSHIKIYPEGAMCIECNGVVVGSATSLRVSLERVQKDHTWGELCDEGFIRNHDPHGEVLYGIDIGILPKYRGRSLSKVIYEARKDLVRREGMKKFATAGRLAGYHKYKESMDVDEYARQVISKKIIDPVLTPQLKSGLKPIKVLRNYIADDESLNCALLMEWDV